MLVSKFIQIIDIFNSFSEIDWNNLSKLKDKFFSDRKPVGLYEVLEYRSSLELKDKSGRRAIYRKTQAVRFLQDNIIAYQDKAWGDGHIFARYECSPGEAVDCYREGAFHRILISLHDVKQSDDEETFYIYRTIENGFLRSEESWQTDIDHQTNYLYIDVIFPADRHPKRSMLIEQNEKKSIELGQAHQELLPDGRLKVFWETHNPTLFESYILKWIW